MDKGECRSILWGDCLTWSINVFDGVTRRDGHCRALPDAVLRNFRSKLLPGISCRISPTGGDNRKSRELRLTAPFRDRRLYWVAATTSILFAQVHHVYRLLHITAVTSIRGMNLPFRDETWTS